jgi:hypothetical protein
MTSPFFINKMNVNYFINCFTKTGPFFRFLLSDVFCLKLLINRDLVI